MRRPGGAAPVVVLLLWLAALTFAFHGCGGGLLRCGSSVAVVERDRRPASLPRKMLLAVESRSLDPSSAAGAPQDQHHHHHHHHHRAGHHHRQRHHRLPSKWNWQRVPPSAAPGDGEEVDPRYGVEKRLVPTGPNPLHH
ncbi:protein FON2 SPARE1-like [Triticum urartu]|uniref:protein FON2 SPARE1-like n=1 Tax=Triticum urartu TaxID=4572 RepID=UPI0020436184|nr:protein FON2 SPARE1-like [Triticum urartu]